MKKVLFIGLLAVSFTACNRGSVSANEVPDDVVTSFNQRYPYAADVEWQMDDGVYEAEFTDQQGNDLEAHYRPDGTLIRVQN